jgi:hypothetical protein
MMIMTARSLCRNLIDYLLMRLNFRENNKKQYQNYSPRNLQKSRAILIDNAKVLFQLPSAKTT